MGAEIIPVYGGRKPEEPSAAIIETLEGLLSRARSGSLVGLGYCTVSANGEHGTGWDGEAGTRHPLGAAIMMLNHRYAAALLAGKDID